MCPLSGINSNSFLHEFLLTQHFKSTSKCSSITTKATGFLTQLSFENCVYGWTLVRPHDPVSDLENAGIITWSLVL